MEKLTKKEWKDQYKSRSVVGGVYCIKCNSNEKFWLKSTKDMAGQKNRYEFFFSTNTCPEPGMLQEWNQYGAQSFTFEALEEIGKGETQTDREFAEDLKVLLELWSEKLQKDKK